MANSGKRTIHVTKRFAKDYRSLLKKHFDPALVRSALEALSDADGDTLATTYRDHALVGQWRGFRELHVSADVLLVYMADSDSVAVVAVRLASHDTLFSNRIGKRDVREYLAEARELLESLK